MVYCATQGCTQKGIGFVYALSVLENGGVSECFTGLPWHSTQEQYYVGGEVEMYGSQIALVVIKGSGIAASPATSPNPSNTDKSLSILELSCEISFWRISKKVT